MRSERAQVKRNPGRLRGDSRPIAAAEIWCTNSWSANAAVVAFSAQLVLFEMVEMAVFTVSSVA